MDPHETEGKRRNEPTTSSQLMCKKRVEKQGELNRRQKGRGKRRSGNGKNNQRCGTILVWEFTQKRDIEGAVKLKEGRLSSL